MNVVIPNRQDLDLNNEKYRPWNKGVRRGCRKPCSGAFFMIMSELEKELLEEPVGVFDDLDTTLAPDEE